MDIQLKFKAWNTIAEHMTEPFTLQDAYKFTLEVSASFENTTHLLFSGLKDKNDIEICQGDIIKDSFNQTSEIDYSDGCFGAVEIKNRGWTPLYVLCDKDEKDIYCEVIGNIYKNPELLKQ